ncbi:MAG: lipoate--protein ligase family protein, partial [Mycobacteriales bacterium]
MTAWRLLTHEEVGAAEGLALDEALLAGYHRDAPERPPTLRLYTYRASAALVGRFQDLEAEVDLEACRRDGAEVGRRLTGGGAIVMGPAQLGVAL